MAALKKVVNGDDILITDLNPNVEALFTGLLNEHGRTLIDRAGVYSYDGTDIYGEAYVSAGGRNGSVRLGFTDAPYNDTSDTYGPKRSSTDTAPSYTTQDPDSFTNPSNAFDSDDGTYAQKAGTGYSGANMSVSLGKTTSKLISPAYVKVKATYTNSRPANYSSFLVLQGYDGSSWSTIETLDSGSGTGSYNFSYDSTVSVSGSYYGFRVTFFTTGTSPGDLTYDCRLYTLEIYENTETSYIFHNIPSGIISNTPSSAIASFIVDSGDWEDGADVNYQLTNEYFTEAHGISLGTGTTQSYRGGFRIYAEEAGEIYYIRKNSSCTATTAYVYTDGGVLIDTATFDGVYARFSTPVTLSAATYYRIEADNGGSSYTVRYNGAASYPVNNDYISYISGSNNEADSASFAYNIEDVGVKVSGENSGWLTKREVNSFTAFASVPAMIITKLISKTTSPTAGVPAIRTFTWRAQ